MQKFKHLLSIFFFAIMFMSIGYILPHMYHKYIDNTQYLIVRYPISIDRYLYEQCDEQVLYSTYTAQVDILVQSHNELNRLNDDGSFTKVFQETREKNFKKAEGKNFSVLLKIPCEIDDGKYFWSGIKTYDINHHEKKYPFVTDSFEVKRKK